MSILMVSISSCRIQYNSYSDKSCYLMFNELMWRWIFRFHLFFFHICVKYNLNGRFVSTHVALTHHIGDTILTRCPSPDVPWCAVWRPSCGRGSGDPPKPAAWGPKSQSSHATVCETDLLHFSEDKQKMGMINVKCWSFNKRFILL